eukprot:scaffold112337_cov12-Tisochrysis_lutea.AAC.1
MASEWFKANRCMQLEAIQAAGLEQGASIHNSATFELLSDKGARARLHHEFKHAAAQFHVSCISTMGDLPIISNSSKHKGDGLN